MKRKNIPNRLTIIRVILVPIFVFLYLNSALVPAPVNRYAALAVFALASFTDYLDGYLARKWGLVSNFGKFMDPLADKLLVCAALICFVQDGSLPAWIVIILIGREFIISGFRLVAASDGIVIAAGIWGKCKTVIQMFMAMSLMLPWTWQWFQIIQQILIYASVALTIISVVDYIKNNIQVLKEN